MKFNVGDEVKFTGGVLNMTYIIAMATSKNGRAVYALQTPFGWTTGCHWHDEELTLIRREAMYEPGQILVDEDDDERKILASLDGVDGKVYLLSSGIGYTAGGWYTEKELADRGCKLKQDTTPTELTIDEIAKKFNLKPEEVRIKKED